MWHKPQLLTAIANLLLGLALLALLAGGGLWLTRLPLFPLHEVVVTQELREVRRAEVEQALAGLVRGNFFNVNLDNLRQSLERLPWVRRAEIRRHWPARLDVVIEEHQAAAHWGEGGTQWVNTYGEVFEASPPQDGSADKLPALAGPSGSSLEVLKRYVEFSELLAQVGRKPVQLSESQRQAWQVRLDDGMVIELGREQQKAPISLRMARLIEVYAGTLAGRQPRPAVVDMRYPNGFALRF